MGKKLPAKNTKRKQCFFWKKKTVQVWHSWHIKEAALAENLENFGVQVYMYNILYINIVYVFIYSIYCAY